MVCASAASVATGTAIPAVVVTVGKGLFGALQTHTEKKLAKKLSSGVGVQAVLAGVLKTFATGNVGDGLKHAASLAIARQIASTIGTNWCDYREGRLQQILLRVAGATAVVAVPACVALSYYTGTPIDWSWHRELAQSAACTAALCAAQMKSPSKSERIEARIDSIVHASELEGLAKAHLKEIAASIDDVNADSMKQAIDKRLSQPLTDGVSVEDLCNSLASNPTSHQIFSPAGLLQLQMIARAGGLV
jgi:hypothetical protein